MEWSDELATGHEDIDEQHRELVHCLSELKIATAEQRTLLAAHSMARLKRYVRIHFVTEESVMRACNYPALNEHIREHEKFRTWLRDLEAKSLHMDITTDMVDFLNDWLVRHVSQVDMDYVPFLHPATAS